MAEQAVKRVEVYETPDGVKHETYEAALAHYQETVCGKAVDTWVAEYIWPVLSTFQGKKNSEELQSEIAQAISGAIKEGWGNLYQVLATRMKAAGNTGAVPESMHATLNRTLPSLGLPERILVPLQDAGLHVVGHVVRSTSKELMKLPKFGAASLRTVEAELGRFGLKVGMDVGEWTSPPGFEEE